MAKICGSVAIDHCNTVNPGFILEGGEVISFIAATDSGSYVWPENVLRVIDAETMERDYDPKHYIALEGRGADTTMPELYEEDNVVGRVWVNENNYDSILIYVPPTKLRHLEGHKKVKPPHGGFIHVFCGLKPALSL